MSGPLDRLLSALRPAPTRRAAVRVPGGHVAVVLTPFASPGRELRELLGRPWPAWVQRLYEMEEPQEQHVRVEEGESSAGAALAALAEHLHHRVALMAWCVAAMEREGWTPSLQGDRLVVSRLGTARGALDGLERAGILGPLINVAPLDERGMPQLVDPTGAGA